MEPQQSEQLFLGRVTSATVRVVLLGAWIVWCLQIVFPFVIPILWGAIIATAVYPARGSDCSRSIGRSERSSSACSAARSSSCRRG